MTANENTKYPFAWCNQSFLNFSAHSGVVLSVEEVEAGLKGLKVDQQVKNSTPFMAEHLEETLSAVTSSRQLKKDGDMTAFNKLVSTMKASGTLPTQPKVSVSIQKTSSKSVSSCFGMTSHCNNKWYFE